ncbi:MAG TPA: class I SAM-dependent methyltransferase [Pseudonocardia sp.]|nr:class I SAM-dependent methyltransferase [Pseudonocardia sp.]
MGSAQVQGPLWGARAQDWAEIAEPGQVPFYEAVFDELKIGADTRLLDVGCGAGLALRLAAARGAEVAGLDAAEGLVAIARRRNPGADVRVGDLEELPFPDATFTAATSFNAVQYASDPVAALGEVRRVLAPSSAVAVLTWGAPEPYGRSPPPGPPSRRGARGRGRPDRGVDRGDAPLPPGPWGAAGQRLPLRGRLDVTARSGEGSQPTPRTDVQLAAQRFDVLLDRPR